jgi:hypothetical protein
VRRPVSVTRAILELGYLPAVEHGRERVDNALNKLGLSGNTRMRNFSGLGSRPCRYWSRSALLAQPNDLMYRSRNSRSRSGCATFHAFIRLRSLVLLHSTEQQRRLFLALNGWPHTLHGFDNFEPPATRPRLNFPHARITVSFYEPLNLERRIALRRNEQNNRI